MSNENVDPLFQNAQTGSFTNAEETGGGGGAGLQTYTVKEGDTLSSIAKEYLGHSGKYTELFDANRDILDNPDHIKPGQIIKIPSSAA